MGFYSKYKLNLSYPETIIFVPDFSHAELINQAPDYAQRYEQSSKRYDIKKKF